MNSRAKLCLVDAVGQDPHIQVETRIRAAETADFPFERARLIANELNADTTSRARRPLVYIAEDMGNGRARIAAVQHGELAFYL